MKPFPLPNRRRNAVTPSWPARLGLGVVLTLVLLAGHAGVGTGGTGAYAQGRISAVQPLVVAHVRYDDSAAQVLDDDGLPLSPDQLQPGMSTEIDSSKVRLTANGAVATASRIRTSTELLGPLATLDRAAGQLSLLGQSVVVDATTVFDARLPAGLDSLAPGQWLQVSAAFDSATGQYRASRLEPASGAAAFKLRGVVAALDGNARVLRIGAAEFDYASIASPPAALQPGDYVKLQLVPAPAQTSRWTVTAFSRATAAPADGREGHLEGLVSSVTSATLFSINGQAVDGSGAPLPGGAAIALGARIQAEGRFQGGVLIATQIDMEDGGGVEYESHGTITSVDVAAGTFVLRKRVISTRRSNLRIEGGTLADLKVRKRVEVHGYLAADGGPVEATEIVFSD